MDSFAGRQKGPVTAVWHNGKFVDIVPAEEVVVDAAADSVVSVEVVDGVVARSTEVVGTATDMVVSCPLMVVATNAAVGADVVLVVSAIVSIEHN